MGHQPTYRHLRWYNHFMKKELDDLLAKGLGAGYAGKIIPETVKRGPFEGGKQSLFTSETNGVYLDQWFAHQNGGGQELVQDKDGDRATRLYGGGNLAPEELAALGTNEEEVINYLIKKVGQLGNKTRLHENCFPEADGDWQYSYKILQPNVGGIPLTIGLESIDFKQTTVFAHGFILSPIK